MHKSMASEFMGFPSANNRILLGNNGFYAKHGNHKELAYRIIEALGDLNKAKEIGQQNRRRAYSKFSWDVMGNKLSKIYHWVKYHREFENKFREAK